MTEYNVIGENIRILREIKGYKQDYMAMMLDMSQSGYAKLESGKSSITIQKLTEISKILEVDLKDLINSSQSNYYFLQNNHVANAHQNVENFYAEHKEVYDKLIKKQEEEIAFLRKLLEEK